MSRPPFGSFSRKGAYAAAQRAHSQTTWLSWMLKASHRCAGFFAKYASALSSAASSSVGSVKQGCHFWSDESFGTYRAPPIVG